MMNFTPTEKLGYLAKHGATRVVRCSHCGREVLSATCPGCKSDCADALERRKKKDKFLGAISGTGY